MKWTEDELAELVSSPLLQAGTGYQLTPSVNIAETSNVSEAELLNKIDDYLDTHIRFMLDGNGGEGKTVALLSWLRHRCYQAIPVYVPLRLLTSNQNIYTLVRSSLGRFGIVMKQEQLEEVLLSGQISLVLDGLNEMHKRAEEGGAVQDIINFVHTLLLLKLFDQKLTLLPVQRLTVIMTNETNLKRKKTTLYHVPLQQQLHQSRPQKISWSLYQIFSLRKIGS